MSDLLPNYVLENYSKAVTTDLSTWLSLNPLPSLCEPKLDGIRVFLFKSGDELVLPSKHGGIYTPKGNPKVFAKVPEVLHAPHRAILDGEYGAHEAPSVLEVLRVDDGDVRPVALKARKEMREDIRRG